MAVPHRGSWFGLPDFGITERLTSKRTAQGGSNLIGKPQPQQAAYIPPQPQVLSATNSTMYGPIYSGPQTSQARGGGGMSSNPLPSNPVPSNNQGMQNINDAANNGFDQIESDYSQAMAMLGSAEQGLQSQAGTATGTIENEAAGTRTALGAEQATKEQGVQVSHATGS
jgi:hypothetical protein